MRHNVALSNYTLIAVRAAMAVTLGGHLVVSWLSLLASGREKLEGGYKEVETGMAVEEVKEIMKLGDDTPVSFEGPKITRLLAADEVNRCNYTLAFTDPCYHDPSVYCYFDANDKLLAAHVYE